MRHHTKRRVPIFAIMVFGPAIASLASSPPALLAAAGQPVRDSPPAAGPPALGVNPWLRVETPNFTLFGEVPEARLRAAALRLEAFRAALEWLHPGSRTSPRETYVYMFKDAKSGWPFTPAPAVGGHHLGVNQQYDVPNYVTVAAPVDDPPLDVLYHSYAHQFLDDNFPRLPLTVGEGLAEFYSGFAMTPDGTLIGLGNANHVRWLRENAALPLPQQLSLDARSPLLVAANGRRAFVAGSWALMHYLVSGSGEKRARLPEFLEALQRGTSPGGATLSAFGRSLEDLQHDVARYVRGDRFLPIRIRDAGPGAAPPFAPQDAGGTRARPMSPDEALAALGDILGHAGTDRAASAEAYHREALRLNPTQARAYAGLGYLRYARNQFDAAVPLLEKAVEIDPGAMSCYLLAKSLLKINSAATTKATSPIPAAAETPPRLARARDLLARAIASRPRFAAPYVALGTTHTLPDGDAAAGIALLQKARLMLPARTDIAGNLVYLFLRQGDFIRAQKLVDEALVHGDDDEALGQARAAIATFQEHLAARQSLYRTARTRKQEAREEASRAEQIRKLRAALADATDPATRAKIEEALERLEDRPTVLAQNEAAEVYNEAVDRANRRDYAGAIALLEGLLPKVKDPDLREKIVALLERFRQDSARLQRPAE